MYNVFHLQVKNCAGKFSAVDIALPFSGGMVSIALDQEIILNPEIIDCRAKSQKQAQFQINNMP